MYYIYGKNPPAYKWNCEVQWNLLFKVYIHEYSITILNWDILQLNCYSISPREYTSTYTLTIFMYLFALTVQR